MSSYQPQFFEYERPAAPLHTQEDLQAKLREILGEHMAGVADVMWRVIEQQARAAASYSTSTPREAEAYVLNDIASMLKWGDGEIQNFCREIMGDIHAEGIEACIQGDCAGDWSIPREIPPAIRTFLDGASPHSSQTSS